MISILFPTKRENCFMPLFTCLFFQTHQDYELIVIDELSREGKVEELAELFQIDELTYVQRQEREDEDGYFWGLCNAYNQGLEEVSGDLVVSLQDFTIFPHNTLKRSWRLYKHKPNSSISALCHKTGPAYQDVRKEGRGLRESGIVEFEMNYASIPTKFLRDIGGWDEKFDRGWHYENQDIAKRLKAAGSNLFVDQGLEVYEIYHEMPEDYEKFKQINKNILEEKHSERIA